MQERFIIIVVVATVALAPSMLQGFSTYRLVKRDNLNS